MKEKTGSSLLPLLSVTAEAIPASPDLDSMRKLWNNACRALPESESFIVYFIIDNTPEYFISVGIKKKQRNLIAASLAEQWQDGVLATGVSDDEGNTGALFPIGDTIYSTLSMSDPSGLSAQILLTVNTSKKQKKSIVPFLSLLTRLTLHRLTQLSSPKALPPAEEDNEAKNPISFVLNTVADGILVFNKENLILLANREAEKIWGYRPGTLKGNYIHKLLEETENAPAELINFLLNPTADSKILGKIIEFIGFRKNKSRFPLEAKIQETTIDGELYFTAAVADITERKQFTEALVNAKEKAEASTRAKEEFLAHISHEIRTPINAIIGLTSLLMQLKPKGEALEYLKGIKVSSDNLLLLVNDVLDLSKIQAGKIALVEYEFELSDVFSRIYQILAVKAAEKNLSLSFDLDPAIPSLLYGDAARLSQVLLNLTSNAIKFTQHGSVFFSAVVKSSQPETCEIEFRVKDTGIGIPENKLDAIFESFTQITPAQRTHASGTGLGLTISKLLVERFGGKLAVKSTPGVGSQFSFIISLPRIPESEKPAKLFGNEEGVSADLDQMKILIVEDNMLNVLVIRKMLEQWNARYEIAANGAEAIELLNQDNFDLILMDISMPVLNGYETTTYIRKNFTAPKRDIPILALTATILIDDKQSMTDAGMNDYIAKPFQAGELIAKIISYTNRGSIKHPVAASDISENTSKKTYDLAYLEKAFNGDSESLQEFIHRFLEQIPESLQLIKNAFEDKDLSTVCKQAHKIKSPFTYLGIRESLKIIVILESGLEHNRSFEEMQAAFSTLQDQWQAVKNELMQELAG